MHKCEMENNKKEKKKSTSPLAAVNSEKQITRRVATPIVLLNLKNLEYGKKKIYK